LLLNVENQLSEKVPDWVDKNMLASIEKKKTVPYYLKLISIWVPSFQQERAFFFSWRDVEMYLDRIVDNIKRTGIQFDAVVGIKTGGAILSDYISNRLNVPNYKIKLSRKKYQCNKTPHDFIQNNIDVYYKHDNEYMICEEIQEDITGKKVILIDELTASGNSMNVSIDYLISKQVSMVYPVAIYSQRQTKMHPTYPLNVLFTPKNTNTVWPWGYDN
jgi:hypoxanthine phosphoribosyltransferase